MNRPAVVIISDEPEFAAVATRRWLAERSVPSFILSDSADGNFIDAKFELAIVGGVSTDSLGPIFQTLMTAGKPVIHVLDIKGHTRREVISIARVQGWPDLVITIAQQIFERARVEAELESLREKNTNLEQQAALGRYMLDVRHNLNNALTSILGNSDLMLLDAPGLQPTPRAQVETIRNMAMRLNEIMQRFSSLQKEMQLIEQQGKKKIKSASAGA